MQPPESGRIVSIPVVGGCITDTSGAPHSIPSILMTPYLRMSVANPAIIHRKYPDVQPGSSRAAQPALEFQSEISGIENPETDHLASSDAARFTRTTGCRKL
jgi:hypothetical protein